jgi:ribokinase
MSVVVVGSLSMDFTAQAERLPRLGETVMGTGFLMVPGGKGNNQAITCARLDAAVTMVGCVGADAFGDAVLKNCADEGVDISAITSLPDSGTGIAHITVDAAGDNAITIVPAANSRLTPEMVYEAESKFAGAKVVLVQLEIPLPTARAALEVGKRVGAVTILNPAPATPVPTETLRLVDLCAPNETEASSLVGADVDSLEGIKEAARALLRAGPRKVVITLGERGAFYTDGKSEKLVPAFPVEAVDTVAAGDAFCGGLATALAGGAPIGDALEYASAAGAVAVTRPGATPSLPSARDVGDLLARGRSL